MSRCRPLLVVLVALAGSLSAAAPLVADVAVSHIFADHMVLQRDLPIKVWGTAAAGETVTVTSASAPPRPPPTPPASGRSPSTRWPPADRSR